MRECPVVVLYRERTTGCFERGCVKFIVIEHEFAVNKHLFYSERLCLIGRCVLCFVLVKYGEVGKITRLYISAVFEHKPVGCCARHSADRIRYSVARADERIAQKLREAVIDRRILNAEILDPCVGHVQAVGIMLKLTYYLRCAVRPHVDPALEIALLAKLKIHVKIRFAVFSGYLMNGLALVFLISRTNVRYLDIL